MWIEKLKSGRYRAVERYTEIMTGKQKKVSVTMDKNTAATEKLVGGNGRIFFDHQYDYHGYEKYFRENTEEILGRRLTPHALRHTHVALLAEQDIPLEAISRRLGHKNSRITADVYFHVTKKLKEKEDQMFQNVRIL